MSVTTAQGFADFGLTLPENWMLLDTSGSARIPVELSALLERGAAIDPSFRTHRGMLKRQLREVIRRLRGEDLALAAVHATVVADVLPLVATVTVAVRGGYDRGQGVAGLVEYHQNRPGHRVCLTSLKNAGDAVHVRFRDTVNDPSNGTQVEAEVFQWLIPVPGRDRVSILTFATPTSHPDLVAAFADLFVTIADTFAYQGLGTDAPQDGTGGAPS